MKKCGKCLKSKQETEFYRHSKDGYQSQCKSCRRLANKLHNRTPKRKAKNKEAVKKWAKTKGSKYYKRADVRKRKAELAKKYREDPKLRSKHLARWIVSRAIKSGNLERLPCSGCGGLQAQAHHSDYSKPLMIVWLCRKCHQEVHNKAEGSK